MNAKTLRPCCSWREKQQCLNVFALIRESLERNRKVDLIFTRQFVPFLRTFGRKKLQLSMIIIEGQQSPFERRPDRCRARCH